MLNPGYRKRTIFLLLALLLVRFWFGQTFELSGQEAYLWLQGHGANLNPSYWERGPFVPLLIRIGTTFFGDTELGVRWLAAVICCSSGFVLFYLARHWFDARTAFWSVVLFIIVPMFAWKLSFMTEAAASIGLMALTMFAFCMAIERDKVWWWLLGGTACGLALLVALPNAWWIAGLLLYFAVSGERTHRLREALLWSTIIFTSFFLLPIVWWWRGPQVAELAHTRIINAWPLSHPFSFTQGVHFIGLEIYTLCPLFAALLLFVMWRLGRELWEDPRYGLLVCLAVPGLIWQNFAAFFSEGRFELVPALFLPMILLAGCFLARLTRTDLMARWICGTVLIVATVQTVAGLNPFYVDTKANGHGYRLRRTQSAENMTNYFDASRRQVSWRNLADAIQILQRDVGATLIIADTPETAAALSFYLPRNPFVYVQSKPDTITHFDFWPGYDQSATPNDSALYLTHESAEHPADPPSAALTKDFAEVTRVEDPPLPDFDKGWEIWNCQHFVGSGQGPAEVPTEPMPEHDALPK